MAKRVIIFLLSLWVAGCQTQKRTKNAPRTSYFEFARHIDLRDLGTLKILHIKEPYPGGKDQFYLLKAKKTLVPDSLKHLPQIQIPLQNIVVTSTTHLPALSMLGLADKLIGFPGLDYISNPVFRQKIKEGKITDLGNGRQLNTEVLLKLHPDLLMHFNSGQDQNNDRFLEQQGIPVLYNADWMEQNPLGRAEWIKLFVLLFQKEAQADSIFQKIKNNYIHIQAQLDTGFAKPKVFQGGLFGDKWYVPGGKSYAVQLINDAGGKYIWSNDQHTGSIALNFENVLLKLPEADIWLNPGLSENRTTLIKQLPAIKNFKVVKNKQIYTYNLKKGPTGGIIYFEESNAYPDRVLNDLYHIFHPAKQDNYQFYYYTKLPQ